MIRNYKRVTEKAKWSKEAMEDAVQCIQNGEPIRRVLRKKGIPFTTFQERVKVGTAKPPRPGEKFVFTREQELETADHVKKLANMFYGLTPIDLRRSAYEFAKTNNTKHTFKKESRMDGGD
jgi:hypothetical protein